MRFVRIFLLFIFFPVVSFGQYSNDWVSHNQTYYKISVATTGIYRITYDQLESAGIAVNSIDPRLIQIFHRGEEQAINFKHNQQPADNKFESGEYLEFYGERNDGTLDSKLYQPSSVQPHKYFNLYNDTAAYFLTVNPLTVQGKRMESFDQVNSGNIPKETWHTGEQLRVYTSEPSTGDVRDTYVNQSYFDLGEGWTGTTICTVNAGCVDQLDFPINQLTNAVTSQSPPQLEIQLTGRDFLRHQAEIYVGPSASTLRLLTTKQFDFYNTPVYNESLNWSDMAGDGSMVVRVKGVGVDGGRERLSVAYIKVNFAQGFDMTSSTSKYFTLNQKTTDGARGYIELPNAPSGTRIFDITDKSNIVLIGTRTSGSITSAVIGNTSTPRKLLAASTFMVPSVSQIKPVIFRELNAAASYIIITHRSLKQPATGYADPVAAFAGYRASQEGGGYDTLTVTVDQLYDQFNYGEVSPTAIYEFMKYMVGTGNPQYLFLVGKGREWYSGIHRRTPGASEYRDLVPPAGSPGSDFPYTAGLKGEPFVQAVPTGRLTASTPQQVADYLNKVKEMEAEPFNDLSRKKVLHLSGGKEPSQLALFRAYMEGFADIARGDYLGGSVETIAKRGVADVEYINIANQINAGVNMVTFFGHSAPNITDINIGDVSNPAFGYDNKGKYPALLANGCNAGEYFGNSQTIGEDWILTADKGARNFIANSSFGFELPLRAYTTYFYQVAFGDSAFLASGIGDVQKEVSRRFLNDFGTQSPAITAQVQQMVLLGDPALKLFGPLKPDFETNDGLLDVVSFDGKPIHALTDSIQVQVTTNNLGRTTKRSLSVKVVHTINDVVNEYVMDFESVRYQEVLKFTIDRGSGSFYGNNKIEVYLDPDDKIAELKEDNNMASWSKFIQFNGTQNLQPSNYGIVNSTGVDALFQDTDVVSGEKTYNVEIDTTKKFNSQFLKSTTVTGKVLLKIHFELLEIDSTVYYWRTKPGDKPDDQWATSSFTYINNGPEGWTQMAFDQLTENIWDGLVADEENRRFEYEQTHTTLALTTLGDANTEPGLTPSLTINNLEYYYLPTASVCRNNTINLVAFDRSSMEPFAGVPFDLNAANGRACGRERVINSFTASEIETGNNDDLIQYINNLKPSDSVVLFTVGDPGFASWSPSVIAKLEEIGIQPGDVAAFQPGEPVIILGRKSFAQGAARIIKSDQPNPQEQHLQITEDLTGYISNGTIESVLIGPALKWHEMSPRYLLPDASDEAGIDVYLVEKNGASTSYSLATVGGLDLSDVDAAQYPFMKLVFRAKDEIAQTPAVLKNWLVAYDPAPDGLLITASSITPLQVQEGTTFKTDFAFVNISKIDFADSLSSVFTIVNKNTRLKEIQQFKIKGPAAGDTTLFSRSVNTLGKVGFNDLSTAVNTEFIPEQYLQNNSIELSSFLEVLKDQRNPILDVTIDGRFVSDGDFVSANPVIRVSLSDDNKILPITDPGSLSLSLTYPCAADQCDPTPIEFSRDDITWSVSENGDLVVVFTPKDLAEGEYILSANGTDMSGNKSGVEPYTVSFVVDRDPGMIFYLPYPNPSATGFYFDFVAAGETAPESFVLQIVNRAGQDVARFTEEESGSLRVGANQVRWNGLDPNGYRLSDGLYFYQLTVRTAGIEYKNSGRLMIIR